MAKTVPVTLYICPTMGCDNYYGSSSMPDLEKAITSCTHIETHVGGEVRRNLSHSRAQCPDCKAQRVKVKLLAPVGQVTEAA